MKIKPLITKVVFSAVILVIGYVSGLLTITSLLPTEKELRAMRIGADLGLYPALLHALDQKNQEELNQALYTKIMLDVTEAETILSSEEINGTRIRRIFETIANYMVQNPVELSHAGLETEKEKFLQLYSSTPSPVE